MCGSSGGCGGATTTPVQDPDLRYVQPLTPIVPERTPASVGGPLAARAAELLNQATTLGGYPQTAVVQAQVLQLQDAGTALDAIASLVLDSPQAALDSAALVRLQQIAAAISASTTVSDAQLDEVVQLASGLHGGTTTMAGAAAAPTASPMSATSAGAASVAASFAMPTQRVALAGTATGDVAHRSRLASVRSLITHPAAPQLAAR
ncbi:MAG: hypothetical protein JWM98_354 [Thermoleophilia bacterium]|nr:hypothetical protein [Thermoleophilia bacterium]